MSMAASTAPTATAKPKPAAGGGKKYGPLTRTQWIIAGSVVAATIGYIFWKRYQAAKSASAASSSGTSSGDCTDDNGNSIPCGSGDSDLSSLEDELDTLLSGEAAAGAGGSSGGTTGTTTGTTGTGTSTGTTGTTGTTTSTGTTTTSTGSSSASWSYPAPTGLKASSISKTGYSISWQAVSGPSGQKPANYTVATYDAGGTEVDQFISGSTSTKEYGKGGTGLKSGTTYHTNVWANGGPKAPAHASVSVTTLKS
jgi:hypothetical protein